MSGPAGGGVCLVRGVASPPPNFFFIFFLDFFGGF